MRLLSRLSQSINHYHYLILVVVIAKAFVLKLFKNRKQRLYICIYIKGIFVKYQYCFQPRVICGTVLACSIKLQMYGKLGGHKKLQELFYGQEPRATLKF